MWHKWAEKTASSFCRLKSGKQNIEKYPNYIKLLLLFLTRKLRRIPSEVPEDTFRLNTGIREGTVVTDDTFRFFFLIETFHNERKFIKTWEVVSSQVLESS